MFVHIVFRRNPCYNAEKDNTNPKNVRGNIMAAIDNFRSSLHGFNRTDVVQFIQQQTAAHEKATRTLKDENVRLQEALTEARAELEALKAENESLLIEIEVARLAILEEKEEAPVAEPVSAVDKPVCLPETVVPPVAPEMPAPAKPDFNELELMAYRRAEMTERMARERATASAQRMKAVFNQVDEKLTVSAGDIATVIDAFQKDCDQLQKVLSDIRGIVEESSADMKAVSDLCKDI